MARTLKSDRVLFGTTLLLVGASVVFVYSASSGGLLWRQIVTVSVGLLLLLGMMRIDYHELRRPAVIWSLLGVTTLALIAVFVFEPRNNVDRKSVV